MPSSSHQMSRRVYHILVSMIISSWGKNNTSVHTVVAKNIHQGSYDIA